MRRAGMIEDDDLDDLFKSLRASMKRAVRARMDAELAAIASLPRFFISRTIAFVPVLAQGGFFQPIAGPRPRRLTWAYIVALREPAGWQLDHETIGSSPDGLDWWLGAGVHDLIAVSDDWQRVLGCYVGCAESLGWLQIAELARKPVRLFKSPADWLGHGMRGIYPVGDGYSVQSFLRALEVPIIVQSVEHGLAIERKLRRDYTMPEIRVAA